MPAYKAPLRDMRFVLYELLGGDDLTSLPGYEDFSRDTIDAVLEEAAKFCEQVLQPINRSGDEEGCHFENGVVRTPKGFKEAYDTFREGGWTSIACDPAYGGQGLPAAVNTLVEEMICSANLSFGLYPGLIARRLCRRCTAIGSDELKQTYLPKLVDGTWSGTMCLTEPHCGTDLGLLRTRAVPNGDGSYKITGTKIFISAGEHDLTENIIHLVLARLPDAPKGMKGISLFLVPKFLRQAGRLARRAQRRRLRLDRAQDGHQGLGHLRHEFRRRAGLAGRRAAQGHAGHVRHDEHRAPRGRHSGPRPRRSLLSGRRRLCPRAPAGPLAVRRQISRQAGRPDDRPS